MWASAKCRRMARMAAVAMTTSPTQLGTKTRIRKTSLKTGLFC
jgi:hypothetical protein